MSYLKRLANAALGRLQAFRMYGGIDMSASSLHRESTDSLISKCINMVVCTGLHHIRTCTFSVWPVCK